MEVSGATRGGDEYENTKLEKAGDSLDASEKAYIAFTIKERPKS